jgi:3'(2'), 5'-bisphosphate nucleotidase
MIPSLADAQLLEKILRGCGAILLESLSAGRTSGEWSGAQFKAHADIVAHDYLVATLSNAFPGVPVVSEEWACNPIVGDVDHFIIDPIDGTASYVHGFSGWVTQAAYVSEGYPVMSGIYAPANNEYFSALRKLGAYCNGSHLSVNTHCERAITLIDNSPEPRDVALDLMKALRIPGYVESGSIALKICRVADRSADLFVKDMSPRDWDVAAPMLILAEAGGVLTDIDGNELVLGRPERNHHGLIAAASPAVADMVCAWNASRK